jgi:hypothetical protein
VETTNKGDRKGTIIIKEKVFTVIQKGIVLSAPILNIKANGSDESENYNKRSK